MTPDVPRIARRLPEPLPAGEEVLWRGAPCRWALALRVFHLRAVAIYFVVILAWRAATAFSAEHSIAAAAVAVLWFVPFALAALGLLALFGYLVGRTTTYTITSRRLILQYGVAFPMTLNVPFKVIESAALKTYADGTGDIPVITTGADRIAYLVLWPHARPRRFKRPEPMLRAVPEAARIAAILSRALAAAAGIPNAVAVPDRLANGEAPAGASRETRAA
ncbi:MAG: photosynthetic complex putative assembly protein PuhB [Xanthobacteraceae bacterium]